MHGSTGARLPPVKKRRHGGRLAPSESPGPDVRRAQCRDAGLCRASASEDSLPGSAGGARTRFVDACTTCPISMPARARVLPPAAPHRILEPIPSPMTAGSSAGAAGFKKLARIPQNQKLRHPPRFYVAVQRIGSGLPIVLIPNQKRPGPPTRPLHKFKTLKPHSTRLNATSPALSPTVKLSIFCA
jgi:hypothetical protein